MQGMKNENRIYLSGGGDEKQSFSLDNFFLNTFTENKYFLYIPIALRGHKLYSTSHLWMKSVIELHERKDIQFETMDNPSKYQLEYLKNFHSIYIGGGNTWNLIKEFEDSKFSRNLIQYFQAGGQIYGGSAGAIIMGKRIDTQNDKNESNFKKISGLNLLNGYSIACHFTEEQNNKFKTWATKNRLPVICLPEEAGLIVEGRKASNVGSEPCVIYYANGEKKNIAPDETFELK